MAGQAEGSDSREAIHPLQHAPSRLPTFVGYHPHLGGAPSSLGSPLGPGNSEKANPCVHKAFGRHLDTSHNMFYILELLSRDVEFYQKAFSCAY